jgi:hypothetical protein
MPRKASVPAGKMALRCAGAFIAVMGVIFFWQAVS